MKKFYCLAFVFLFSCLIALPISYQGKLTDFSGLGMNDTIDVYIEIYDDAWGGTLIDADTVSGVTVEKGLFSAIFDLGTPLSPLSTPLYFQVGINDGTSWHVLSPRQQITASFAAMWANRADWAMAARHADYADSAGITIATVTNADSAKYAIYADTAYYTAFVDSARVSGIAHFADTSGFTVNADTANYTVFADSTRIAAFADSARISAFADSAGAVTWDMISNYFKVINDTAFHQITASDTLTYITFTDDTMLSIEKINSAGQIGVSIREYGHPSSSIMYLLYDSLGLTFWAGDTIVVINYEEIPNGITLLMNNDTLATFTIEDDSDGIALKFDRDTLYYLNYDSLMTSLLGTDDIWGALSDTFDTYADSLINVIQANLDTFANEMNDSLDTLQSRLADSIDAFRSELSDTLSARFIGGTGTIPSGSPSIVINEANITAASVIMVTLNCTSGTNPGFNIPLAVLNITDGVSFTVGTADGSNVPANLSFEYIIFKP